jgi:hypothetical protein
LTDRRTILCIDDVPEEPIGNSTLEKTLRGMFKSAYGILFEKNPQKAYEAVRKDLSIALVFLDIDFGGDPLGPQIADVLKSIRPELKVIVLTSINRHGEKIRFGKKPNVRKYIVKKDLEQEVVKARVVNIAKALIDDPENKKWTFLLDDENETITMTNDYMRFRKTFNLPSRSRQKTLALLYSCTQRPNECLKSMEIEGFIDDPSIGSDKYVNEVVYETNNAVREATDWITWGILDSLGCGTNEVRLVVGSVVGRADEAGRGSGMRETYDELIRKYDELNERVRKIEKYLKI